MSHPVKLADACASAIGPAGVLARALVGITLIARALLRRDPDSPDAALGLVAMPGVIVGALAARAHRWPQPLRASGPLAHARLLRRLSRRASAAFSCGSRTAC